MCARERAVAHAACTTHRAPRPTAQKNTYVMMSVATVVGFVTAFAWKGWHSGQKKLYEDFYSTNK